MPDRKKLAESDTEIRGILTDAAETPTERPKKKQKFYYSGKKKRHTLKTQLLVNADTSEILTLNSANGKRHDFRIFKESRLKITDKIVINADTGYIGIPKLYKNAKGYKIFEGSGLKSVGSFDPSVGNFISVCLKVIVV